MARRAALQVLFVFLLVAGQQSALVHSVWHLHDRLPAHEQQESGAAHGHDDHSSESRLCDLHAALGALLAGDCGGKPSISGAEVATVATGNVAAWRIAQRPATPPSRAPPSFS